MSKNKNSIKIKFSLKKPNKVGTYLVQRFPEEDLSIEECYIGRDNNGKLRIYMDNGYDGSFLDEIEVWAFSPRILVKGI